MFKRVVRTRGTTCSSLRSKDQSRIFRPRQQWWCVMLLLAGWARGERPRKHAALINSENTNCFADSKTEGRRPLNAPHMPRLFVGCIPPGRVFALLSLVYPVSTARFLSRTFLSLPHRFVARITRTSSCQPGFTAPSPRRGNRRSPGRRPRLRGIAGSARTPTPVQGAVPLQAAAAAALQGKAWCSRCLRSGQRRRGAC